MIHASALGTCSSHHLHAWAGLPLNFLRTRAPNILCLPTLGFFPNYSYMPDPLFFSGGTPCILCLPCCTFPRTWVRPTRQLAAAFAAMPVQTGGRACAGCAWAGFHMCLTSAVFSSFSSHRLCDSCLPLSLLWAVEEGGWRRRRKEWVPLLTSSLRSLEEVEGDGEGDISFSAAHCTCTLHSPPHTHTPLSLPLSISSFFSSHSSSLTSHHLTIFSSLLFCVIPFTFCTFFYAVGRRYPYVDNSLHLCVCILAGARTHNRVTASIHFAVCTAFAPISLLSRSVERAGPITVLRRFGTPCSQPVYAVARRHLLLILRIALIAIAPKRRCAVNIMARS